MKSRVLRGAVLAGLTLTFTACEAKKDPAASLAISNDMTSAIVTDNAKKVKELLDKGESIEATQNGQMALHLAAETGKLQVITTLLARGANVNTVNVNQNTPLMLAARACKDSAMLLLINQGAKIESADKNGVTPLHLAAGRGCLAGVKLLIDRGANPQTRTNSGIPALAFALNRIEKAPILVRQDTDVVNFLRKSYGPGSDTVKANPEAAE